MESHITEPSITYCNNTKARILLDFVPKTNVFEGLKKTWNWFKQEHNVDDDRRDSFSN